MAKKGEVDKRSWEVKSKTDVKTSSTTKKGKPIASL